MNRLTFYFSILISFVFIFGEDLHSRESTDKICMKRGFEVILPYQHAIDKIKELSLDYNREKSELKNYKMNFEKSFIGIGLYKDAGCSTSRLEEFMTCLVETDGRDCKIYYSQMRLVD